MPSTRRVRVFGVVVLAVVVMILYLTADARQARNSEFYTKTSKAMDAHDSEDVDIGQRLKEAEHAAKKAADVVGSKDKEAVLGGSKQEKVVDEKETERSVAGRKMIKPDSKWEVTPVAGEEVKETQKVMTPEEREVEIELNSILKRSPIIIFSKSYCPFSKKAKSILLEKYKIVPAPFVVELDEHELGPQLQAALEKTTGRRTVPNVLINGKSIGGGDDVEELHTTDTLIEKVKKMGGKRIMEAKLN